MTFHRTLTAAALALTIPTLAHAQTGTGSWWWEASTNNGTTWVRNSLDVHQNTGPVLVRAVASWSPDAGRWFAGVSFDAVVERVGPADLASNFLGLTAVTFPRPLAASRFGSLIKIDDPLDTSPPGEGSRAVSIRQFDPFLGGDPSPANPIPLFQFTLTLDGSIGDRRIAESFLSVGGGNPADRFMWIYNESGPRVNYPLIIQREALTIRVIPSPPTALALLALTATTRRRSRPPNPQQSTSS